MTKTKAIKKIQQFCTERRKGAGYLKYVGLQGESEDYHPMQDFKSWYKGPGTYVIRIWPPFRSGDSPWFKYAIQLD